MHDLLKDLAPILTVTFPFLMGLLASHESHKKSQREEYQALIDRYKRESDANYKKWMDAEKKIDELRKELLEKG
ncbi:hypothetical protein FC83_GL000896 [Agrilactobacillus composti DSM 18527 = JCM 14202]|uniref:Uncharacterized protein n=1 Tax=Agrilactobacillus composti DSM 18527 = JCM 14202 TaxID=1423734 RepID=X0PGF1_9LACO|nr:hypothetical protein [Agrilactobacillus composti]KRM35594.1 hypothetical protein FC83_GL000896 [Agrilactobacillus composti DSM 18527 = JCM 14202]GAF41109.1 hypothetical protein JCM14202_3033 [Agrilactobacillus composti DSM 18527 = JCM 14202]